MIEATTKALARIETLTGAGETAQGFDLFDAHELHKIADVPVARLHATYDFSAAVRYLAKLVPGDAAELASTTNVEID